MTSANFKIENELNACGNPFGLQMLSEHDRIPEIESQVRKLEEEGKKNMSKIQRNESEIQRLSDKIELYSMPFEGYWSIRERLVEVRKRDIGRGIPDHTKIKKGDESAHAGDLVTDVTMFKRGRTDTWILEDLYGVEYQKLLQVRESRNLQLTTAIDKYATINNRAQEDTPGSRLTHAIKSAYQSYLTVQFENISADPIREGPSTPLFKTFYEFLIACG